MRVCVCVCETDHSVHRPIIIDAQHRKNLMPVTPMGGQYIPRVTSYLFKLRLGDV